MTTNYHHGVRAFDKTTAVPVIRVGESGEIGIIGTAPEADNDKWPLNVPVAIVGDITKAESLGGAGTLPIALKTIWKQYSQTSGKIVVVRVEEIADPDQQKSAVIGDVTQKTGVHAFRSANTLVGIEPDLLIAPGFANATADGVANAVVNELVSVANRLRSFVFFDGPNTSAADAVLARENYGSDRAMMVDNYISEWDTASDGEVQLPGSILAAAMQSKMDLERGFWWPASNKPALVNGTARVVDFRSNDSGCEANFLNSHDITTIIRDDGFRLWGTHTLDSEKLLGGTIVGRRVADKTYDALERGLMAYIDVPTSIQALKDIAATAEEFLRSMVRQGALISFQFELPLELNSARQMADGKLVYRLKFVEAASIREIQLWGYRTPDLYEEFLTRAAAVSSSSAVAA
ncbi:phage tail sheath subtilisin-like domain-containing protein [Pseudovibrio exalbescens]|uniref:phage tail sheath subtilisin-like domain-containing protein n=1 Tax=Pseudovibrio exalbescens TaxID=197461 RepID=UPI00236675BF|nr:phage tail sheath subtilisin-like domain-containing protein [Pseudovibrio exalbescens]MDD7908567.1 phage tail sheath subtilisin-like domain-containing protein [Pseudovibrio exalbescens]